jgi:uncharacterized phage protein gp47/JayE
MAFQVKNFRSILAGMINLVRGATSKLTDFRVGSVTRTMLEAPAGEIESLYLEMFHGIMEAIPVAIYQAFDFQRLAPAAAYGDVTFIADAPLASDVVIPAGTVVKTAEGLSYATTAAATLVAGQTSVSVSAQCETIGAAGNVPAATLVIMTASIAGIDEVTNISAISNGRDEETDDERKARFQEFVRSLPRGTKSAIAYGASTARLYAIDGTVSEYVNEVAVIEEFMTDQTKPVGFVRVVISSGSGAASSELVDLTQDIVDGYTDPSGNIITGWKAAGVIATVESAVEVPIDVTAVIEGDGSVAQESLLASCEVAISDYISTLRLGGDCLVSGITVAIATVPGVYNVTLTDPAADVEIDVNEIATIGEVTLT